MDPRLQRILLVGLFFVVSLGLVRSFSSQAALQHLRLAKAEKANIGPDELDVTGLKPANATLGFGAVVAVSREGSPRRESLLLAANITEIDITIPSQPKWTDDDINALRAEKDSTITRGSALAWLGHLNALRWFLSSNHSTILILEDDVDWDIHLRTTQIPAAAAAIRTLTSSLTEPASPLKYIPKQDNYWGINGTWDILYLGHCGDIFKPSSWSFRVPRVTYEDPTLPPRKEMHPYTSKFLESIGIPVGQRMMHQSIFPLCTFGFALTRHAAYRLLHEIAARESDGGTMAYDVRMLEACRDLGFRCWSANPELFHHMDAESEIASVNTGQEEKVGADESGRLKPLRADSTPNIACGARSKDFFTRDRKAMEYLREVVGRKGQCLRDIEES